MTFIVLLIFVGLAVGLVWYLLAHDHGEREPVLALWLAAGFGLLGGGLALVLEKLLVDSEALRPGALQHGALVAALSVGVIEEACKFLPLALVLYKKRYFNEHTDGVIYFALAGLGFGLPENLLYTSQFGAKTGTARLLLIPLFHAAITGSVGYCLIRRKLAFRAVWGVAGPLAAAMLLHGLYDYGLASGRQLYLAGSLLTTLLVSAGLFWLFLRAQELDQDRGLSVVGHNNFCRACGFPNPHHYLYCVHCGKNA